MFIEESRESCWPDDGRAWEVDGRAQALVGPGLAMPLVTAGARNTHLLRFSLSPASLSFWNIPCLKYANVLLLTTL